MTGVYVCVFVMSTRGCAQAGALLIGTHAAWQTVSSSQK